MKLIFLASLIATATCNLSFFNRLESSIFSSRHLLPQGISFQQVVLTKEQIIEANREQTLKCYDTNSDRSLSESELYAMHDAILYGGKCPTDQETVDDSDILDEKDLANLEKWMGKSISKMTKVYESIEGQCYPETFRTNLKGKDNVLIVLKTLAGNKLGFFTPVGYDNFDSAHWRTDSNVFLFSLTKEKQFKIQSTFNEGTHCYNKGSSMFAGIAWALWISATKATGGQCAVEYNNHSTARARYGSNMLSQFEMLGTTSGSTYVSVLETYQITF